jgi:hypothetical protein
VPVADVIPDLWRANEDAVRVYQFYLSHLLINDMHERVVAACRQIRRYAARGPGATEGLFTISIEIESLCALKDYEAAWRRLRLQEEIAFGKRIDLRSRQWSKADWSELIFSYAPLSYFRGRYRQGCRLLETWLDFWFTGTKPRSFEILFNVYSREVEPTVRGGVTLSHFYARLGRNLRQWRHWEAFVNGFHPRLFRVSGVPRDELLADPARLAEFSDKLIDLQRRRCTSGVDGGESDLIESPAKVKKRQDATRRQLAAFRGRTKPVQERTDRKLKELFPDLPPLSS